MMAVRITALLVLIWATTAPTASAREARPDGAPMGWPEPVLDSEIRSFVLFEQLEYRRNEGSDSFNWDAQGWIGGDYQRAWFKTEGQKDFDGTARAAEVQVLYSRLIAPFWDLQAGARYDIEPDPARGFAVLGIQGLAPYFFEVDAAAFVSDEGDVSARVEATYDLLLTQRLIAEPRLEIDVAVQEVEELGIGQGFNDVELGLRLRYEIVREFAPYVGVSWSRELSETADFARREGEDVDNFAVVLGVRAWF